MGINQTKSVDVLFYGPSSSGKFSYIKSILGGDFIPTISNQNYKLNYKELSFNFMLVSYKENTKVN